MKTNFRSLWLAAALVAAGTAQTAPVPVEQEPSHHLVLKNDFVEVMRVALPAGESSLYHTHGHDGAAVELSNATIVQQKLGEAEGPKEQSKAGEIRARTVNSPYTHRLRNVGDSTFEVLDVEFLTRPKIPSGMVAGEVVAENPSARVYRWNLAPGESSVQHAHARPYLIVASVAMQLKMTSPDGRSLSEAVKAGDFHWVDSKVTHSLTNEGTEPGEIVEIELK